MGRRRARAGAPRTPPVAGRGHPATWPKKRSRYPTAAESHGGARRTRHQRGALAPFQGTTGEHHLRQEHFQGRGKADPRAGHEYDYSGGGYTVAEAWLEIATGKKFKDYLKEHVLDPLGMTQSTYETGSADTPNLAWGCSRGVCLYNVRTLDVKAAGGLLCHPVDYARVVALMHERRQGVPGHGYGHATHPCRRRQRHADAEPAQGHRQPIRAPPANGTVSAPSLSDGHVRRRPHHSLQPRWRATGLFHRVLRLPGQEGRHRGAGQRQPEWTKQREVYGGAPIRWPLSSIQGRLRHRRRGQADEAAVQQGWRLRDGRVLRRGHRRRQNKCVPKKADNETCDVVGGGHQCKSGPCASAAATRSNSVAMGGTCYVDDACTSASAAASMAPVEPACARAIPIAAPGVLQRRPRHRRTSASRQGG